MSSENSGAIVVIYKISNGQIKYLLPTQKNGMINFVGGAKEVEDRTFESTIRREISEETNLRGGDYSIRQTDIVHKFVYGGHKEERAGKDWENKVFIAEVHPDLEVSAKGDTGELNWYTEEEAIEKFSFKDMRQIFEEAVEVVKRKHE